jgi:hypothetical protein
LPMRWVQIFSQCSAYRLFSFPKLFLL